MKRPSLLSSSSVIAVKLISLTAFFSGLSLIVQVLVTRVGLRFYKYQIFAPEVFRFSRHLQLVIGFVTIYFSLNLLRRKKIAWLATLIVASISILLNFEYTHLWYTSIPPLTLSGLLIINRQYFRAKSESGSLRRGLALFLLSNMLVVLYGTAGFWLLDKRDFGINFSLLGSLDRTLRIYLLGNNSGLTAHTRHASWFLDSLQIFGLTGLALSLYSLFRPLNYRLRTLPHERELAEHILSRHGQSSLDYFTVWPDKTYFFSSNRRSYLAYGQAYGTALVLGDPIGPVGELPDLIKAFAEFCLTNSWRPVFLQTGPHLLNDYKSVGMRSFKVGEEAIVDLDKFCNHISQERGFRSVKNRFTREGYQLVRFEPPHAVKLLTELRSISDEWLSLPGRAEHGFSLGYFTNAYLQNCPIFTIQNSRGPIAFANQIPSYRPAQGLVDMMRHRLDSPNSTMDFLFLSIFEWMWQNSYQTSSLGLAPLAGMDELTDKNFEERIMKLLFENANNFFSFKGLRNFKAKFNPAWEPRYMVYAGNPKDLISIALAQNKLTKL